MENFASLSVMTVFSSTADTVSGAYQMPSLCHPSVGRSVHPSVNLFSNQIGSLSFHLFFPIFGMNVNNNIAQKVVEVEFLFFFILYLLMDL